MRPACPNVITLNQYVSGALDESKAEDIAEHLAVCDRCQQRSDEMASRTDGLIGAVRRGAAAEAANDEPQLARLITKALHAGSGTGSDPPDPLSSNEPQGRTKLKSKDLESFIDGLRRSRLMNEKELHRHVVTSDAEDADSFARELIQRDALTAYQARALSRGRWKGLVLGNYTIVEKLGKGGMGQVYKARHDRMGRTVCLKVLRSSGRRSPEIVERFRREIKTHSALRHPNFVVAHDADEAEGIQFLVMEFIDGRDLARRVKDDGPVSIPETLKIIRQTAAALDYAHDQGVIHRDIKPHNLLVAESGDDSGQVKVLDMGLARFEPLLDGSADSTTRASMTASGVIMGTVDYMSPEQALNSRNADARSDIYSLGCTMFFLLTGTTMFDGETLMEKIIAHREQPLPSLRDRAPEVPAGLDAVFQKMVARNPDNRYQSMQHLGEDLDACLHGRRPSSLAAPWSDLMERIKARPALFSIPAAAVLLAGLALKAAVSPATRQLNETTTTSMTSGHPETSSNRAMDSFIGSVGGIPAALAADERGSESTEHQSETRSAWRRELPRKVALVVADRSFRQEELDAIRSHLKNNGFESVIASSRKGKLHSWHDKSGKNGHVYTDMQISDLESRDFFSIVLMTGNVTHKFAGHTSAGKQLQQQLRNTLSLHGSIVGLGPAQSLVTDEAIIGAIQYEDCEGLCVGNPKQGTGTVIKVAESKQIPKMAWQLRARFEEAKKKLSSQ